MNESKLNDMNDLAENCSRFIKDVTAPIKKQHSEEVEKYIDRFIKFPGASFVVSILFGASDLVAHPSVALLGMVFVALSLLVALNIYREEIYRGRSFYESISQLESPMVDFRRSLTRFSRNTIRENELQLIEKYNALQASYEAWSNAENPTDDSDKFNRPYLYITISFYLLVAGICFAFLSTVRCF